MAKVEEVAAGDAHGINTLVSQENIDLMKETASSMAAHGQTDPEPKAARARSS